MPHATKVIADPVVDTRAMSATATISTGNPDRSNDVLVSTGCDVTNYVRNPVILLEHGLHHPLPVGTCQAPDGELALSLGDDDNSIVSTCFFSSKTLESEQLFELVVERTVRAASVGFIGKAGKARKKPPMGDRPGVAYSDWELVEWSWCAVGDNPDALAKALARDRLAGAQMAPCLRKSLQRVMPKKQVMVQGASVADIKQLLATQGPELTGADIARIEKRIAVIAREAQKKLAKREKTLVRALAHYERLDRERGVA